MRRDRRRRERRRGRGLAHPLTLTCAALAFAGCATTLPPPEWPPAEATDLVPQQVRPDPSLLVVATHVDLSPFGAALEAALASLGPAQRSGRVALPLEGGGTLTWDLARAPLALSITPQLDSDALVRITERLALKVTLDAGATARCTTTDAALAVTVEGTPILANGPGLTLALDRARVSASVEGRLRCHGNTLSIDVPLNAILGPLLSPIASLASAALSAARVSLPSIERELLTHLDAPLSITRADGTPGCLDLHAADLVLGPIAGNGTTLEVALGLDVAATLSLSHCPPPRDVPATRPHGLRVTRGAMIEHFSVSILLAIPLPTVEADLRASLAGAQLDRRITLGKPSLNAARGRLIVSIPVAGALHGTLVLWGTPTIDGTTLTFPDIRLALKTRSALEANHFAHLAADNAPDAPTARARTALRRDLSGIVGELRAALGTAHTYGNTTLTPTIAGLRPTTITVDQDAFRLTLIADGTATLKRAGAP